MGRRRRNNAEDIIRGIAGLVLLLAMFLCGNDFKKLPAVLIGMFGLAFGLVVIVLAIAAVIAVVGGIVYYLVRRSQRPKTIYTPIHESRPDTDYAPHAISPPELFTLGLVKSLEWRRFEMLVEKMFTAEGYHAARIRAGADGGVDLALRDDTCGEVIAIVQCKAWSKYTVGVKPVRELYGVMAADNVLRGYFVCCGGYSREAIEWVKGKPMELITGEELVARLNALDSLTRSQILTEITSGDFSTPTCPSCDTKLVKRKSAFGEFWGCANFPRCRYTLRGNRP